MADFSVMMVAVDLDIQQIGEDRSAVTALDSLLSTIRWNVDDLTSQLEKTWQEIPQETMRVLYHSMSRRVAALIYARGASTPY
ncbi:hypothetical protein TNCV_4988951 [Trichonephila clavipes]|nr:hypothetical protein TNCV_4988951 [Trichonephila clavipes]